MIYFIRHAQSAYNQTVKKLKQKWGDQYQQAPEYVQDKFRPDLVDAGITQFGVQQCHLLVDQLKSIEIDLILVSPMRRALQTCDILFKNHPSKPKIVAEPLFRQCLSSSCDIGARIQQSISMFPDVDFSRITDKQAWYIHTISQKQTKVALLQKLDGLAPAQRKKEAINESLRLLRSIYDLKKTNKEKYECYQQQKMLPDYQEQKQIINSYLTKYSKIAIVSHSKCIKRLLGHRIQNGKLAVVHQNQLK